MATTLQEETVWEVEARKANGVVERKWIDAKTNAQLIGGLEDVALPLGYRWTSNWRPVVTNGKTDPEGWINEGSSTVRKRLWSRKRERPTTSTVSAKQSSSSALKFESSASEANIQDEPTMQKLIGERLKRLKSIANEMSSMTIDKASLDALSKESKERIESANTLIARLSQSEKAIVRAAAIKLGNELLEISKRVDEAYSRAIPRTTIKVTNGNGNANFGHALDAALREEEEQRRRAEEAFVRQQQLLQQMEQQHQQILKNEVDTTVQMIEERHEQIEEASRKAAQLNAMMAQVSKLVAAQGEQTQALRATTEKNKEMVVKGLTEVRKAEQYQQDAGAGCLIC